MRAVFSEGLPERFRLESPEVLGKSAAPDQHLTAGTPPHFCQHLQAGLYLAQVWNLRSNPQSFFEGLEYLYSALREERITHVISDK